MARTRLAALLVVLGLGAAGVPAAAAPPPAPSELTSLDPVRGLHAAALDLLAAPSASRAQAWRVALLRSAAGEEAATPAEGPREWTAVHDAGDVDGDRRSDVVVMREESTVVRSGRDGRVLLQREGSSLIPVAGAGAVRLVALDVEFSGGDSGYAVELTLSGLDRTGRPLWEHVASGSVEGYGIGPAYAGRADQFPAMLYAGQRDAAGAPALLLGALTGAHGPVGAATSLELTLLSVADGSTSPLPGVQGVGTGTPWAFPFPAGRAAQSCYATTAPVATVTRAALQCDSGVRWTALTRLNDPYVGAGGDFDGDRATDLVLSTFGFEPPGPGEPGRGTQVLAYDDGSALASSPLDGLSPIGGDASGDGQPDFLAFSFEDLGFGIRGVTLAGEQLWKRSLQLRGSGSIEGYLGLDVTGDGLADALLRAAPEKGTPVGLVVDGRDGRTLTVPGADALLAPGLRARGADLAVLEPGDRRLQVRVVSGDHGRRLLDTRVPMPRGTPATGGAGTADVDGDRRRDLVLTSRAGDRRLTTAVSATGRVLWQHAEKAPPREAQGPVVVVGEG